jgi:hypothetical protein
MMYDRTEWMCGENWDAGRATLKKRFLAGMGGAKKNNQVVSIREKQSRGWGIGLRLFLSHNSANEHSSSIEHKTARSYAVSQGGTLQMSL